MTYEVREAAANDAESIAETLGQAFKIDMPFLPILHTQEEDLEFTKNVMLKEYKVWVGTQHDKVVGFIAYDKSWVNQLYILTNHQGKGLGSKLLEKAKSDHNELNLWTFQKNLKAIKFYEGKNFKIHKKTDGQKNEEKEPDIHYIWKKEK